VPRVRLYELQRNPPHPMLRAAGPRAIVEQPGHFQPSVTVNSCLQVAGEALRDAANTLNAALGGV